MNIINIIGVQWLYIFKHTYKKTISLVHIMIVYIQMNTPDDTLIFIYNTYIETMICIFVSTTTINPYIRIQYYKTDKKIIILNN